MDKKYLDALASLAGSMEMLVDSLLEKEKAEKDKPARPSDVSSLNETLIKIQEGVEHITEQNSEILAKQDTIIALTKGIKSNKESKGLLSGMGEGGASIMEGTKTIILMAGAIMAVGMAFKIVGDVDFVSVIALSVALPLVAMAVAKIAEIDGLGMGDVVVVMFAIVAMAAGITLSSWILNKMEPVQPQLLLTTMQLQVSLVAHHKHPQQEALRHLSLFQRKSLLYQYR